MTQTASNPLFGAQMGPDPAAAPDLPAVATAVNPIYHRSVLDQDPAVAMAYDSLAFPTAPGESAATAAAAAAAASAVIVKSHADANVNEAATAEWAASGLYDPLQGIEEVNGEDSAASWLVGGAALQPMLHQASQVGDLVYLPMMQVK